MVIIYNIILTFLIIIFFPIIFTRYKFDKINRRYDIWIHCASLGEVRIALKIIENIIKRFNIDKNKILLTTTTTTAKNFAKKIHIDTYMFPLDYFLFSRKLVKSIKPKILIIIETELWPNYIYYVKKYHGKIFVVNGRMTRKTFVFFKIFKFLLSHIFKSVDFIMVREKIDYLRFKNIGFKENTIKITGNMKYDDINIKLIDNISKRTYGFKNDDFIICFGSIREKEEKEIINKLILKFIDNKNIKFILAPRHLKLINKIKHLLEKYNIKYKFKSVILENNDDDFKCLILDTYGELKNMYYISDIVFVCGTILPYGGQNIIEPATLSKLVVFGKYTSNFLEPANLLLSNNAAIQVENIEEFVEIIKRFYKDTKSLKFYGENAKNTILKLKGATDRNIDIIFSLSNNLL